MAGVGAGATALVGVLLRLDALPLGVSGQWVWLRRGVALPIGPGAAAALGAVTLAAVIVFGSLRAGRVPSRATAALLLVVILGASAVALVGLARDDPGFGVTGPLAVMSDVSMGYYTQALSLSGVSDAFSYYRARAANPDLPDRVRTHPPGPIVFFYCLHRWLANTPRLLERAQATLAASYGITAEGLRRKAARLSRMPVSRRDAVIAVPLAFIVTMLPALIVLPAYGVGTVLFDRRRGLVLALLAVSLPSLLHFAPSIDGIGAFLALGFVWLWLVALRRGQVWLYVLAALGASVMLLWSFGFAILLVLALIAAVPVWGQVYPDELSRHLRGVAWAIVAFGVVHEAVYLWSGYNLLGALPISLAVHRQILAAAGRSYWVWLPMNLYDFLLFMGPALAVGSVVAVGAGLAGRRWPALPQGLVIGVLIMLALLLISGSTRAEAGRIWLFLMPLAAVPAADYLAALCGSRLLALGGGLVVLQVLFAVALHATLLPVSPF